MPKSKSLKGLNSVFRDIIRDSQQYSLKKMQFAREHGLHAFNLKKKECLLCGKGIEEIKRAAKSVPIRFDEMRLEAYPGCKGRRN